MLISILIFYQNISKNKNIDVNLNKNSKKK